MVQFSGESASLSSDFVTHLSYACRPYWTPLSPVTIMTVINRGESKGLSQKEKKKLIIIYKITKGANKQLEKTHTGNRNQWNVHIHQR